MNSKPDNQNPPPAQVGEAVRLREELHRTREQLRAAHTELELLRGEHAAVEYDQYNLALEALRESEFFFRESQRAANIGSYKTDFSTGLWESSEVLDRIFGIDGSYNRTVQGWVDIVHPQDREMMERYLREEVIAYRKPFNKEYRIIRRTDGESRWVNGLGNVCLDDDGNIRLLIGTIQDITERKLIELFFQKTTEELHQQRSFLKQILDASSVGIFTVDMEERITLANQLMAGMFGWPLPELHGKEYIKLVHPEEQELGRQNMRALLSSRDTTVNTEKRYMRANGTEFLGLLTGKTFLDSSGKKHGFIGAITDITDRKQIEATLAEAFILLLERKTFFESIITNLQSGLIVTDLELQITVTNPYVHDLFRISAEECSGTPLQEFCPELAARISAGIYSDEIVIQRTPSELTIGFTCLDLKNSEGKRVGHIINFRDLTEIVKIRREIRQKERLAAMGEVIAGVAHEMRNPLFGMTSVGQILSMELNLSPSHQELITSFMKESNRLNRLVQDLLNGTKELRLQKKPVNLSDAVDTSLRACHGSLLKKNIEILRQKQGHMTELLADPEKLEQVFQNLIQNAIDACAPGGKIEIIQETADTAVSVAIIDTGKGITEKDLPRIFDFLYTTKKSGNGMGLAISKNIAEAHGGTLMAENVPGKGARFTLKLPLNGITP